MALRSKVLGVGLSIPLLAALIGAGVGVLVSELVGVGAAWLVGLKPLTVSAPLHTVVAQSSGATQPLLVVLTSSLPAKDIRQELSTTSGQLDKEAGIGRVYRGGDRGDGWNRLNCLYR